MEEDRLSRIEDRLDALTARLSELERRLGFGEAATERSDASGAESLDSRSVPALGTVAETAAETTAETLAGTAAETTAKRAAETAAEMGTASSPAGSEERAAARRRGRAGLLTLIGRTLLILGGAFLLRAATDAGTLPLTAGTLLGLLYGWLALLVADRAAAVGRRRSATSLGLVSAIIVFPLLTESTLQFHSLSPGLSALLLGAAFVLGQVSAFRRRHAPLGWIHLLATSITLALLMRGTGEWNALLAVSLLVGLLSLWQSYLRDWWGQALMGAAFVDLLVPALTLLYLLQPESAILSRLSAINLFVAQIGLISIYMASFYVRMLLRGREISLPESLQTAVIYLVGIGGAFGVARDAPQILKVLGPLLLIVGVGGYAISFVHIDRKSGNRRNFAYSTTVGLVSALVGITLLLDGNPLTVLLIGTSLFSALIGARYRRATLSLHAALYLLAAGFSSGLIPLALDSLTGSPALGKEANFPMLFAVIGAALLCCAAPASADSRTWGRAVRLPRLITLMLLVLAFDGLLALVGARLHHDPTSGSYDAGAMAAWRTALLSISAVLLGGLSRFSHYRDAARLVPVLLVAGAAALVLGDLRSGRPATMVVSLVAYGGALILAPRLAKQVEPGLAHDGVGEGPPEGRADSPADPTKTAG